jgi:predicted PurR-regulated permease PerM
MGFPWNWIEQVPDNQNDKFSYDRLTATSIELMVRLGVLGLLLYWSFTLLRPFITIAIWSVVLTVALYPAYNYSVFCLGGRRRLAAALLTSINLIIVIGPATWLVLSLIDTVKILSTQLELSALVLPLPSDTVKSWPIIGGPIFEFWHLAATNLQAALAKIIPELKPLASTLVQVAADTGMGIVKFFIAIIVTGFLLPPAPSLLNAVQSFASRLASKRGEGFLQLAAATIRAVSRGIIGISALQALLAGIGLVFAGIPGASLLTSAILILGILQIGPSIVIVPLIIWSWMTMNVTAALLFTIYMIPVNLMDNLLRPLVMGRGLATPTLIILIGVIGGTISYGITGLFLGPIVLAVIWELLITWLKEQETV